MRARSLLSWLSFVALCCLVAVACSLEGASGGEGAGGSGGAGGCDPAEAEGSDCLDCAGDMYSPSCVNGAWVCDEPGSCGGAGGSASGGAGGSSAGGAGGSAAGGAGGSAAGGAGGGQGGAGPACATDDACESCLANACEAVFCGCDGSPSCGGFIACIAACAPNDAPCSHACAAANEGGIALAARLGDCSARSCAGTCPAATRLDACQSCLMVLCEPQVNTCFSNPDCVALVDCATACAPADDACLQNCGLSNFGGISDAQALGDCRAGTCGASCGG